MLHILVSILRIIGIILLVMLGIALVLILLVLFVPVRYRVYASISDEQEAYAKVRWLMRIFGIDVCYAKKQLCVKVRLFWFFSLQILPSKPKVEKQKAGKHSKKSASNPVKNSEQPAGLNPVMESKPSSSTLISKSEAPDTVRVKTSNDFSKQPETKEKSNKFSIIHKIQAIIKKLKYTISSICDKITNIKNQADYYMELLQREQTKQAFSLCKGELMRILRHIVPRKISGEFVLGMEDPASTGQIYGIYCASMMLHNNRVRLIPDFDHKILKGHVHIKGRIRLITFVYVAVKMILDKNIRNLIKTLKQKQGGI